MPRAKGEVNKSQAIRELLATNRKMPVKKVIATLDERGISVGPGLVYYIRGRMKRHKKVLKEAAAVAPNSDALSTVLKVKKLATELGGLRKLKALVDALNE